MSDLSRPPDFLARYHGGTEHSTGASAESGRGRDQVIPARGREGRGTPRRTDGRGLVALNSGVAVMCWIRNFVTGVGGRQNCKEQGGVGDFPASELQGVA